MYYLLSNGEKVNPRGLDVRVIIELHLLESESNTVSFISDSGVTIRLSRKDIFLKANYEKFHKDFRPNVSPQEMLSLGVFSGKYINDFKSELPDHWLVNAKIVDPKNPPNTRLNYFGIDASQPLSEWKKRGWIKEHDPCGWFQWYCRYYLGRRIPGYDEWQIGRWKSFVARHKAQVLKNCKPGDISCRRKQKQGLLHWAYLIK